MSRLILGTAQLTQRYGAVGARRKVRDIAAAVRFLETAWELGIRAVDTAPAYGDAEEAIGASCIPFEVHSKLLAGSDPQDSVSSSLRRLRRDHLDLVYVHDVAHVAEGGSKLAETLARAKAAGASRTALSVYSPADILHLPPSTVEGLQIPLNVFDRRFEPLIIESAQTPEVWIMARSVFLQGVLVADPSTLTGRPALLAPYIAAFQAACGAAGISPLTACLAWIRRLAGISGVLVGAQSTEELSQLVSAWGEAGLHTHRCVADTVDDLPPNNLCDPREWTA